MTEGRKIAAILVADIAGYSRLMGADEEGTFARLRSLRSEVFLPTIEAHGGRVVNRTGDGAMVEFKSVVEAVRSALEIERALAERNAPEPSERRIEIRAGIHLGDVIETADGDLYGDAVNIAARLEGLSAPGGLLLSEDAWRQVRDKLPETFVDLGERELKNIARPMRVYALGSTAAAPAAAPLAPDHADPHAPPASQTISSAVIGVIESVARLSGAHGAHAGASGEAAPRRPPNKRSGVAKAVGILETVERIVDVVADRTGARDAAPPDPSDPPSPGGRGPRS